MATLSKRIKQNERKKHEKTMVSERNEQSLTLQWATQLKNGEEKKESNFDCVWIFSLLPIIGRYFSFISCPRCWWFSLIECLHIFWQTQNVIDEKKTHIDSTCVNVKSQIDCKRRIQQSNLSSTIGVNHWHLTKF